MRRSTLPIALLVLGLAACGAETTAPGSSPAGRSATVARAATSSSPNGPVFVRAATGSPAIANPVVSFWARADATRSLTMVYTDGSRFMEFKVPRGALLKLPSGKPVAAHDSVLVTATLVDAQHLVVDFQPSGLRFSGKHPASLKFRYGDTDPDVNGDGVVNAVDSSLVASFHIWRREKTTLPWIALKSVETATAEEIETEVLGFTSYGIAY